MRPKTLDHVALWVADRERIADFVTERLSMHVIERTDKFTLVGTDARRGKLTLFEAEGPRERGALQAHRASRQRSRARCKDWTASTSSGRTALRTSTSTRACGSGSSKRRPRSSTTSTTSRCSPPIRRRRPSDYALPRLLTATGIVAWRSAARASSSTTASPGDPERPLLNHLAVLVDSADEHLEEARELGIEVADVVDAANTYAVFVWGPERVKIEYVEHKPTFALK